ncbi:MAG: ABC transporter ATP-binding protein [Candidatus Omnitrophica bacterium]|nr:ABC transporter ATP-binding protein [Candidatus Omnitrophota bacterium]
MNAFKFIHDIFAKFPALIIQSIVLQVMVSILGACSLVVVSPLVDVLTNAGAGQVSSLTRKVFDVFAFIGVFPSLKGWLLIFFGFVFLTSVLQIIAWRSIMQVKYTMLQDLMRNTFEDFFKAQWYFFSSGKQGTLINTFSRELTVIGDAFSSVARSFVGIIQMIIFLFVPVYISWQVTLISFGVATVFVIPFFLLGKHNYRLGLMNTSTANEFMGIIHENLSLTKIMLGFGNQFKGVESLDRAFGKHKKAAVDSLVISEACILLYRPFAVFVIMAALFSAQKFNVPLSEIMVLILALFQAALAVNRLVQEKNKLENFLPSYEQIESLRARARTMKQASGKIEFAGFKKELRVEKVSFAYPQHPDVLRDINISIPKGQMIAFVGKSGAGKSTLIDIIMGFYEPIKGSVSFDGMPLQEFNVDSYRRHVGYVPQESVLFNASIRDNLLWAKPDATDEELRNACRLAFADEFIDNLAEKYNTLVGDRGVRLSGGQVQRIALARALLRRPDLLILDEATSALDTHSERVIQKALENILHSTTVIVVAHRLSTIKKADCIYVLDSGCIIEQGTYSVLVEDNNAYFNSMVKLQELGVS